MLPRVLEPEVMDTPEEAADYDAMDNRGPNASFCEDVLRFAVFGRALDVGTGTALIPIALCTRAPGVSVVGVDLAEHMLALGRANVTRAGLDARIELRKIDAKGLPFANGAFEAVLSNSIVHHIPQPLDALREMHRVAQRFVFVRDLLRPASEAELLALVQKHGGEPADDTSSERARHTRQTDLLAASLRAALTLDEVREIVRALGVMESSVAQTSDRHFTLAYEKLATA